MVLRLTSCTTPISISNSYRTGLAEYENGKQKARVGQNYQPRVDIIIAARNEERYLGFCLDALREQDYPTELLKIYLVDNGSTDRTVRIAQEFGINVLIEPKRGAAAARNAGLAQSNAELVGFVDAHCIPCLL